MLQNDKLVLMDTPGVKKYSLEEAIKKVILGRCSKSTKKLPEESIDIFFIDLPYFIQLPNKKLKRWIVETEVEAVNDEWDKFGSFKEYDNFIKNILIELKRVMKLSATIWVIVAYHNIFRIGNIVQDIGFWILNNIHWIKTNPMPNWLGIRFTNVTETLIWAVKDKNSKDTKIKKNKNIKDIKSKNIKKKKDKYIKREKNVKNDKNLCYTY